jgi:hypothetical protein
MVGSFGTKRDREDTNSRDHVSGVLSELYFGKLSHIFSVLSSNPTATLKLVES